MHIRLARAFAIAVMTAFVITAAPAFADTGDALATHVVNNANLALKNAMNAQKKAARTVAQVPPVTQTPVGTKQQQVVGFPKGLTYTLDFSVANGLGNIGKHNGQWLPGGMDAVLGYGFNPTTRLVANYYELQHYPYGFNSGTVPVYLQGFANPIGCADLSGGTGPGGACSPANIDVTTKDRFFLLNLSKLILLPKFHGMRLPLVITPTYVARWSKIAASTSNNDVVPFQPNPGQIDSFPINNVQTRTAQLWSVAFTAPFLKTSKMFGTFTLAPGRLNHPNGVNQNNTWQLYQILYLEYTPDARTKFFFEPQSSRDYLPADPYPQHLMAYFLGASERIGKDGFVQVVLNSGQPTNEGQLGVQAITLGNALGTTATPTIGGLKATQIQIQFGIGSPSVIQF